MEGADRPVGEGELHQPRVAAGKAVGSTVGKQVVPTAPQAVCEPQGAGCDARRAEQ